MTKYKLNDLGKSVAETIAEDFIAATNYFDEELDLLDPEVAAAILVIVSYIKDENYTKIANEN